MDGRRFRRAALGGVLFLFLALVRCDGDGPSGTIVFEVGGEWIEVSTLVSNDCDVLDIPPTSTTDVTIIPSESQITFVYHLQGDDLDLTGTFNSQTGVFTFSLSGPGGSLVQSGRFTSNTRYTSETEVVLFEGAGTCTARTSEVGQRSS